MFRLFLLLIAALTYSCAYASETKSPAIHRGDPSAVKDMLQKNYPQIGKIEKVIRANFLGLYEVVTGDHIFYTDEKAEILIDGQMFDLKARRNLTEARARTLFAVEFDKLPLELAVKKVKGDGSRKPFFSDLRRRGASPFQRMGTNVPFQTKSLQSFFKPNTNMTTPFVSPFRSQASPFRPVSTPGDAGQENPSPTFPFAPAQTPNQGGGTTAAGQPGAQPANLDQQIQPALAPFTGPVVDDETYESEE